MDDDTVEINIKINKYFYSFFDDIAISRGVEVEEVIAEAITKYIKDYINGD